MLIKPFYKSIDDISDIENIIEKRRFIIIYRYSKPHSWAHDDKYGVFRNNVMDVYLINDSVVEGVDYIIPKGITLYNRNCYRGVSNDILDLNENINYNATISFAEGSFLNRVSKVKDEPFTISSPKILLASGGPGGTCYDDELMYTLKSDYIQPYPKFYNIEDQAHLKKRNPNISIGDFTYDIENLPIYSLGELCDRYTQIALIDIQDTGNLVYSFENDYYDASKMSDNSFMELDFLKEKITTLYINVMMSIMDSIFSKANVIIDIESGTFNVPIESLSMKFSNITKEYITKEYAKLLIDISQHVDYMVGDIVDDIPNELFTNNFYPNRLNISISNTISKIKLSNINKTVINNSKKKDSFSTSSNVSSSDSDELVQRFCIGE